MPPTDKQWLRKLRTAVEDMRNPCFGSELHNQAVRDIENMLLVHVDEILASLSADRAQFKECYGCASPTACEREQRCSITAASSERATNLAGSTTIQPVSNVAGSKNNAREAYTPDQQRAANYIVEISGIGGGDDPVGFLIASHAALASRSASRSTDEVAWLIERFTNDHHQWFAGWNDNGHGYVGLSPRWSMEAFEAVRFCRQQDAEEIMDGSGYFHLAKAIQHLFLAATEGRGA